MYTVFFGLSGAPNQKKQIQVFYRGKTLIKENFTSPTNLLSSHCITIKKNKKQNKKLLAVKMVPCSKY